MCVLNRVCWFIAVCVLPMILGCQGTRKPGFPHQEYSTDEVRDQIRDELDWPQQLQAYFKDKKEKVQGGLNDTERAELRQLRNDIITSRVVLIDLNFSDFVMTATVGRQSFDFAAEIADLGVDLAATVVGSAGTKTILSSISAGISGTQTSVHKNFYYEKTIDALLTAMNAQRKKALVPIQKGMRQSIDDYPLAMALNQLDQYFLAGTFIGAFALIQSEAADVAKTADEDLANIIKFIDDNWGNTIRRFWRPVDTAHETQLKTEIDKLITNGELPAGTTPLQLINNAGAQFEAARVKVLTAVGKTPQPVALDPLNRGELNLFLYPVNQNNQKSIRNWMDANGLAGTSLEEFIDAETLSGHRQRMVEELGIPVDGADT